MSTIIQQNTSTILRACAEVTINRRDGDLNVVGSGGGGMGDYPARINLIFIPNLVLPAHMASQFWTKTEAIVQLDEYFLVGNAL